MNTADLVSEYSMAWSVVDKYQPSKQHKPRVDDVSISSMLEDIAYTNENTDTIPDVNSSYDTERVPQGFMVAGEGCGEGLLQARGLIEARGMLTARGIHKEKPMQFSAGDHIEMQSPYESYSTPRYIPRVRTSRKVSPSLKAAALKGKKKSTR